MDLRIATLVFELHIFHFFLSFKALRFGCLQLPLLLFNGLSRAELVLYGHKIHPIALSLLFFPAGAAHP